MRVLMTADAVGGVWTYTLTLIRSLAPFGVQVTLAVLGPPPSGDQLRDLLTLSNVDWCHHPGPLEWMPGGADASASTTAWLVSLAERTAPSIVHLNGYGHAVADFGCPVLVVAHSCVCSWWRAVKREAPPERLDGYRDLVRRGLQAADVVVAPTHAMLAAVTAEYGLQSAARVIPNGSALRVPATWAKEALVFSAARFYDEAKNLALLEHASSSLTWPVVVAGHGPARQACNMTCLGRIDHAAIESWLARASIYVLPARYEPFGLSALEAAQMRCALVLGDIPSLREVWGASAVYVDPDDPDDLEQQVNSLARNDRRRRRLANAARHRAERYSARAFASSYYGLYESLMKGRPVEASAQTVGAP